MYFLRKLRIGFFLVLFLLLFSVLGSRLTLAAGNDDLIIANELSAITGVSSAEIVNCKNTAGNWKKANQYLFDQYTINHGFDITQATVDGLKLKGYPFKDILIAARLATAFNATPEAILKLKPMEMDWSHYGGLLQQYLFFRKVFRKMDRNPGAFTRSKEEILATELLDDTSVASILHNSGLSGEELLGIITLADLNGVSKERMLSELGLVNSANKQPLAGALQVINGATGI